MRAALICTVSVSAACREEPVRDPSMIVREFYRLHPHRLHGGLPDAEERAWLSGFLSESLIREFEATTQYQRDWIRRNPDRPREGNRPPVILKPPFACGVHFTGVEDAGAIVHVGAARQRMTGSWEVPLQFSFGPASSRWRGVAVVVDQRGQYRIQDVAFLADEPFSRRWTITEALRDRED